MKRYREVVFSATAPEDRNVIWIFPVTKDIDNDLKDSNIPVESFNEELYKVMIWGLDGWVNLFYGPLKYIKEQLLQIIGNVPEGQSVVSMIETLETAVDLTMEDVHNIQNSIRILEGLLETKVDKETGKGLSQNDFTNELLEKLNNIAEGYMTFKDILSDESLLPSTGNTAGDVYLVGTEEPYTAWIYSSTSQTFKSLGTVIDFSNFYTKSETYNKSEVENRIDSKLTPITVKQKYQPQGVGYWRGGSLYPLFVDPMSDSMTDVSLGGNRGVLNFYEMHNYFNIAFDAFTNYTAKQILGGKNGSTKLAGILSLYNPNTQRYTHLYGGDGTDSSSVALSYKMPCPNTDGGSKELATRGLASPSVEGEGGFDGLMSAQDKEKLENITGGPIPIGGIIMWSGSDVPNGWALCNGQTVNGRTTPDLRGKFIMSSTYNETITLSAGQGTEAVSETIYAPTNAECKKGNPIQVNGRPAYGELEHKITGNEIKHYHTVYTDSYTVRRTQDSLEVIKGSNPPTADNTMRVSSQTAMQIIPAYYVLAFIMRIA